MRTQQKQLCNQTWISLLCFILLNRKNSGIVTFERLEFPLTEYVNQLEQFIEKTNLNTAFCECDTALVSDNSPCITAETVVPGTKATEGAYQLHDTLISTSKVAAVRYSLLREARKAKRDFSKERFYSEFFRNDSSTS